MMITALLCLSIGLASALTPYRHSPAVTYTSAVPFHSAAYGPKYGYSPAPGYHSTPAPYHHPSPVPYHPSPKPYHGTPAPKYHSTPYAPAHYSPYKEPVYHKPKYGHPHAKPHHAGYHDVPYCAKNTTDSFCLHDSEYPTYEVKEAIESHLEKFNELYADVADQSTRDSVDGLDYIEQETYLCPSDVYYAMPARAINTAGKWRVIVNINEGYHQFTQTVRLEKCLVSYKSKSCPLVPECYDTKCLQKSIYHRFLVYDSYDKYFPFAIETFQLPASCACHAAAYLPHPPVPHH